MNNLAEIVNSLFLTKKIDGFLGYRRVSGHILPYLFLPENSAELTDLISSDNIPRYPLPKILVEISRAYPEAKIGLLAKECEERALHELIKLNQLNPDKVLILPSGCCPSELKESNYCSYLSPSEKSEKLFLFSPPKKESSSSTEENINLEMRFSKWQEEFRKCLKCYGCRNICPVYICKECALEDEDLIPPGEIPPPISFHLVRAVHMAGFCIDCGLCAEVCPAEIPLRQFYQGGNLIMEKLFWFKPGRVDERSPFHFIGLAEKEKRP